jgi:hypothetical protein|nr:MAG TPA: hypothetical protein [Caudoviricetes sp.]
MIDVNPTSDRWKEICEITDEKSQNRALRKYVYELEHKVHAHETELEKLRKENKKIKDDLLSIEFIKEVIATVKSEAHSECNQDWSGLQEGF